jgi:ABC-2 type transport system ATP-binding protein
MKQRLAVAAAIMHDPDLIILDEPTNGLDPAGIREFRGLVRDLAGAGKTIFVSSHILSEVEQICDDVGILKSGRLITQSAVAALRTDASAVELRTTDDAAAMGVLRTLDWVQSVATEDSRLVVDAPPERSADISRALALREIYVAELRPRENTLEDFFLEVTGEESAVG